MQSLKRLLFKLKFLGTIKIVVSWILLPVISFIAGGCYYYIVLKLYDFVTLSSLVWLLLSTLALVSLFVLLSVLFDFIWEQYDRTLENYFSLGKSIKDLETEQVAKDYDNWLRNIIYPSCMTNFVIYLVLVVISIIVLITLLVAKVELTDGVLAIFATIWSYFIFAAIWGEMQWEE